MRDEPEQSYHTAIGNCLEAMIALRRFSGKEAIEELKAAIRSIEYGQRKAEEKHRREMRVSRLIRSVPTGPIPDIDF